MPTASHHAFEWTSIETRHAITRCRRSSVVAFGLAGHGVRATATARVAIADSSNCMKPWAIPDKWVDNYDITTPIETNPPAWTEDDTFDLHSGNNNNGPPLANPDTYTPPSSSGPGSGFTVAADLGTRSGLKQGGPRHRSHRASSTRSGFRDMTAGATVAPTTDRTSRPAPACRSASGMCSRAKTAT